MIEIISTNIGTPKTVIWQGKEVQTGIFKTPVNHSLLLENTDVKGDFVIDRKYHGGVDKACYLFSKDHYPYWKEKYPELEWEYGMFGENLTVKNCNEKEINIGDTYEVGSAIIQVSQPRQPCFKLGIRFNSQKILKEFINQPYSGIYFRIIQEGEVKVGDNLKLINRNENGISVADTFKILYHKQENPQLLHKALNDKFLSETCKNYIQKKYFS